MAKEIWRYIGLRRIDEKTLAHTFVQQYPDNSFGREMYWGMKRGQYNFVIGAAYEAEPDRTNDGCKIALTTLKREIELGIHSDALKWEVDHSQEKRLVSDLRRDKKDAAKSLLGDALAPLRYKYARSDRAGRAALIAQIIYLLGGE